MATSKKGFVTFFASSVLVIAGCSARDDIAIRIDEPPADDTRDCRNVSAGVEIGPIGAAPELEYESVSTIADLHRLSTVVAVVDPIGEHDSEVGRSHGKPSEGLDTLVWFGQRATVVHSSNGNLVAGDTIELVRPSFETTIELTIEGEKHIQQVKAPPCGALPLESGYVQPYDDGKYLIGLVAVSEPSLSDAAWQPAVGPGAVVRLTQHADGQFYVVADTGAPFRSSLESSFTGEPVKRLLTPAS